MEESKTEKLGEKRQKINENSHKKRVETDDKENLDPAKQLNKQETNTLKGKENIVNNWFNMTEEERTQRDAPLLETPPESEDNLEGSRKFAEPESGGTVSRDTDVKVVDVDPKPQNAINSLESEKAIPDVQSNEPIQPAKKWTSFFTQLRRGQATFSKYTP
ncbi:hypothetical protein C2G38_543455 [Gigaspora rosea]|uniref:Uncharacterized protein n=1 Tax=Gigaspora rosea TaxID=44941 RepID=A0A397UAH0_9GLOM|nr:hypothetical protein C2G38_543455 [Gigaspora rosea]